MQHETKMENQSWLKKLARRLGPGHVVNLCFIVVLLFSTLLTWREVVVLEDAYISSQRNHLENVANALDKHLQYNVDKLIFLRNGMREALVAPLDFTSLRDAVTEFEQHRDEHAWQIELNRRRTLSVNGVSDALVSEGNLLSRENESLDNEITAALEVGYLLRLAHNTSSMVEQAMYVSRAGFYVSTQPTLFTRNVPTRYYGYVTQPWFIGHSQRENRHRAVRWFTSQPEHASNTEPQVTVSVPVDSNNYWYGVLGMSIPVRTMQQFLRNAIDKNLIVDDFEQGLSHCVESALVDDVHGVVYRVPEVTEAGVAVRVIVDDVYAGNLPQVVYIHMVVCHFGAFFFGEEVAEAQAVGCVPYLVHVLTGGSLRELFLVEGGVLSAHHVEQDAVAGIIAVYMRYSSPILRAQAPSVVLVCTLIEVGDAIVFGVKEDDVDAYGWSLLL